MVAVALYHQFRKRLKGVPNSGPRFSQAIEISYIYKMYLKGIKHAARKRLHCFGYP